MCNFYHWYNLNSYIYDCDYFKCSFGFHWKWRCVFKLFFFFPCTWTVKSHDFTGTSIVASAPSGNKSLPSEGNGNSTIFMRVAKFGGSLGSLWIFLGVDTKETWIPALAKATESWKKGMRWPKVEPGSSTTWRWSLAIISFSRNDLWDIQEFTHKRLCVDLQILERSMTVVTHCFL